MNDTTDREINRLRGKQEKLQDIKKLFGSELGQRVLTDFIATYCVSTTFDEDERKSVWKQGRRDFILQVASTVYSKDRFAGQIKQLLENIEQEQEE
jgi:hypothetical protein